MSNAKTLNGILNAYIYGRMTKTEVTEAINQLLIEAKIETATHIYINFQSTASGYCDEIGVDDIPNYIKELREELQQSLNDKEE